MKLLAALLAAACRHSAAAALRAMRAHRGNGTCPSELMMLRHSALQHTSGKHPEMKVVEVGPGGKVRTGLGPSFFPGMRYLVFDENDDSGFIGVKCKVQSAVACLPNASGGSPSACGRPCVPNVRRPPVEYVQMQLGGLVAALAASSGQAVPERVAVVGVGAGSVPSWLLAAFPDVNVDAADDEEVVMKAAVECFGLPASNRRLRRYRQESVSFIKSLVDPYDAVVLDVAPMPKSFLAVLPSIRDRLRPGGVFIANGWAPDEQWKAFVKQVAQTFPQTWMSKDHRGTNEVIMAILDGKNSSAGVARDAKSLKVAGAPAEAVEWALGHDWHKVH